MNIAKKTTGTHAQTRKEITNTAAGKKIQLEAKQYQRMRQSFFTNLLLLGFDKEANEKKDNVIYNEDTFVVANNKGALTVLHFLLNKLDPEECKTRFRGIWPVFDKKQEQSFRKETCSWLNKIALEDSEANFSRLNPSLFLSPGGYRFQLFLFQLSKYVMLKSLKRECGLTKESYLRCPVLKSQAPHLTEVQVKILKSATVRHMRSYVENVKQSLQVHSKWHEQVGDMVKNYRMLCKKVRAFERKEKQNTEEKETAEKWDGDKLVKDESLEKVREDWLKFRKTIDSQNEECEIIKSILQNLASHYKIDLKLINARIPDLLLRVQEHQIQERQIDNLYKEGKLNLVSLVQLLNLSLEMYYEKFKSAVLPTPKENIAPLQQKSGTHSNLLQNMQTLRENMKEQLHLLKTSVQKSAEKAEKKAIEQKLLPLEFTLNAPTPPRNFQLLCDRSVPVDSPLSDRRLPTEEIDTPEAAKKIQMAAKESALKMKDQKKVHSDSLQHQLSLLSPVDVCVEKKNKLPIKVSGCLSENKDSFDSTPQIRNHKSLDKASLRMQIRSLGVRANSKNGKMVKTGNKFRSKSVSDFSEKKGVEIWADQIVDHVMGVSDVVPQNITEALSMDAFKSRDKLARSPVKSTSFVKSFSTCHENIPEIEIDAGTPSSSSCQKSVNLSSVSSLTELYNSPVITSTDTKGNGCNVSSIVNTEQQSSQIGNNLDISLDAYLQLPSDHKGLNLDIFEDVPCPKMHFSDLNSGEDASDRMTLTDGASLSLLPSIQDLSKDCNSKDTSEQQDIDCSDYFTPLKFGLHLKRTSNLSFLEEKPAKSNQSSLLDTVLTTSMAASLKEPEEMIFEDEDPVFLVP
ncbi:HAUS6 [Acanthosepion pharaonis]|uniref:HAUS6 n=1 Tax=Acanthosepion pharaonis TaxID=158019 RepID=A0A812BV95_ACAPH|nr:HAUS6 [Sepia pharaonis]